MEIARVASIFPEMDASSAVFPTIRRVGDILHLAYYLPGCNDSAVVTFFGVTAWRYGLPNDEGLTSHPLWKRGVTFYNFHEIDQSELINYRRWIATFHDGAFYVSATDQPAITASKVTGKSPWEALDAVLGAGKNDVLDEYI